MAYEVIVQFCAPTLAGIKVGSLFSYRYTNKEKLVDDIYNRNIFFNKKGIYLTILKMKNGLALIYVYRKNKLEKELTKHDVLEFLKENGYNSSAITDCLHILRNHLKNTEFPHEIGAFLGYPIDDVRAFIHNKGENYKAIGWWKVYHDVFASQKIFDKYNEC
ncbi:MAG: DUF3793 family protein [Eubacteriales bacterium]